MPSFDRIVQLEVPRASGRTELGSGTLVGDRLVLTAGHVVESGDGGAMAERVKVLLPALGGQISGWPVWSGLPAGLDAALVELDAVPSGLSRRRAVRWGRLTGQRPGVAASAMGFPRSLREDDGQRVADQPSGRVNPGVGFGFRYDLLVDPPHPLVAAADPSPWSGLSGAGLVDVEHDLLIGVVALDVPNFQAGRLGCVPVWRLLEDPDFRARLAEHDVDPGWQSVELAGLFEPEHGRVGSPAALLRADAAVVRFRGREDALEELRHWCAGEEGLSVALVSGPGGQGKTRLARQLREGLRADGWVAGFSRELLPDGPLPVLADSRVPVLVVIDYAETRVDQVRRLVAAAADPERAVRLLLLARSPAEWWSNLRARWRSILGRPLELELSALEDSLTGRQQAYTEAVQDLAGALPKLSAQAGIDWPARAARLPSAPDLSAPAFGSVLTVQLLALTALLGGGDTVATSDPSTLEDELLEHEQSYWQDLADRRPGFPALQPVTLRRAVATATLCGAAGEDQAVATLARVEGLRDRTEDEYHGLARWLADLYPNAEGRYWGPLQPDRVGEHLVSQVTRERPAMVTELLTGAEKEQAYQVLTVLTRAAGAQPHLPSALDEVVSAHLDPFGPIAVQVALQAAVPGPLLHAVRSAALQDDQLDRVEELLNALPKRSLVLAQTSLEVQQHAANLARRAVAANRKIYLPNLAASLSNLAVRLGDVGLRPEGLAAAQEAVDLRRELVEIDRRMYLPDLARSVSNLANRLGDVGRGAEGLAAAQEAVDLRRELVEIDRRMYLPDLARSVSNLANRLGDVGRGAEGLAAAQEAVDLRRELVEIDRRMYLPDLAGSVSNLAVDLATAGRRLEGLAAAQEAVDLYRKLVETTRDAYLPELALSINNLANRLAESGDYPEGLAAAQEAVDLRRELVKINRDAYLPDLAMSVNNLANRLGDVGRYSEGLVTAQEAVDLRRELVKINRDAYLPDLAMSVNNLANRLGDVRRYPEGLVAAQEAVNLCWELVGIDRKTYLPDLAKSMSNLAVDLARAGQRPEGLVAAREAVESYRELIKTSRDTYLPGLARSVNNLAIDLAVAERLHEGLAAAEEAMKMYRELSQTEPEIFGLAVGQAAELITLIKNRVTDQAV